MSSSSSADPVALGAESVVQRQLDAYNRRDIDAFMACYASNAKLYRPPQTLWLDGHEAIAARYGTMFEQSPRLHASIVARIVLDQFVIDHEHVEGQPRGPFDAAAIYEVTEGRIANVWFVVP
ncbi:MAG TPA: nuclear transport factor 2 family protein [Casimicrobiaceae bacterium]|nr:nuclear transport factor 2 family protein [Casimicrobiaceae bacterium]